MKKVILIIILVIFPFVIKAQNGEILSFKIIGVDYYPSGPKLNTEVTVKYSRVERAQLDLIVYLDNAPLPFGNVTPRNPYGVPTNKICNDYILLNSTQETITKKYKFLIPIKYKQLTNGDNTNFYTAAVLLDTKNIKLMSLSKIQTDISKLKTTTCHESSNSPQEIAKREQERAAQKRSSEKIGKMVNAFGTLLGGTLVEDELCSNCQGAGCSMCNGTGRDNTASYFAKSGVEEGLQLAKQSNSEKVLNGNHTVTYSDGTYSGNFKDGLRHGKGTFISANGEKYVGDWEYGNMTGNGTLTGANGFKYVGEFVENKIHGNGELHVGGDVYKGWFNQGEMSGIGTFYYNKEKIYIKGIWEDGDLVKELKRGKITSPKASTQPRKNSSAKSNRK